MTRLDLFGEEDTWDPGARGDTNTDTHDGNWPTDLNLASYLPSRERYVHTCILTGMHLGVCHT